MVNCINKKRYFDKNKLKINIKGKFHIENIINKKYFLYEKFLINKIKDPKDKNIFKKDLNEFLVFSDILFYKLDNDYFKKFINNWCPNKLSSL